MHQTLRSATFAFLAASTLGFGLTSCGDGNSEQADASVDSMTAPTVDSTAMMADDARMGKPEGVMVDGVAMTPDKTIVQNAVMASSVSTLVKAVQAAGLDGTLSGPGPFTVFAPTNAAFDKLPAGALAGLLKPESKDKLAGVLTYHVIQGRLVAQDLKDGQELTTVNGEKLKVMVKDGVVMIGNGQDAPATVQIADVISSNGVTHVIDAVILPLGK
ncbi:fasciclin domain-containing protein [Hymenobacter rubripertinctus]|uniref:Fasciclin domain-containing protein n=1 Tax=Hymenobacter rubripertinctus TaxID=2029981 RepID=A0A418R7E9_9BACT|nr:fasciclin domain-containing protein [Hymenobacter rubripertinctus]RIY13393.1 fasciclin domain-containing protein [Hymenobacter rubripertinctus]